MVQNKLIVCQSFSQNVEGYNMLGQLCHLTRFFTPFKPKYMIVMEKIINILKTKPNLMAEYHDIKSQFDDSLQSCLRRLFKSSIFHKFVQTDTVFMITKY